MQVKVCSLIFAFLLSMTTMAQIYQLPPGLVDKLKATTTVFFYSEEQASNIDSIKQALTDGWKLTPLIFDDIKNFEDYASDPKYSYFIIEGYVASVNYVTNTHHYMRLRLHTDVSRKGQDITTPLCRIELFPNSKTMFVGAGEPKEIVEKLYSEGVYHNWSPILLKAQLEAVAANLEKNIRTHDYHEFKDKGFKKILAADTLYVPKRLLVAFNPLTAKEEEIKQNIFSRYRYKYRICTDEELFDIFQVSKRGRLLFEYVKSSTDKFITIYDLKQRKAVR